MTTLDQLVVEHVDAAVHRRVAEVKRPEFVQQRTVQDVTGMPAVDYLEHGRDGEFPTFKVRRLVFAKTSDVVAFIESHRTRSATSDGGNTEAKLLARVGARRVGS